MERPPIISALVTAETPSAPAPDPVPDPVPDPTAPLPIGQHLFEYLCGTAGTGKTTMAKRLVEAQPGVVLAATTGIAAVNLGEGTTINALLRYFDLQSLRDAYRSSHLQATLRRLRRGGVRRIVLDEVSMLQGDALTMIVRALQEVNTVTVDDEDDEDDEEQPDTGRRRREPPPPIGLTLVGDFGQLPPVPDKDPKTTKSIPVTFAFESAEWGVFAPHVVKLEKIWRQDNRDFIRALHAVRKGDVTTALAFFTPDRFEQYTDEAFDGTTIFAKNVEVDRHNQLKLDKLTGPPMVDDAIRTGKQRGDWKQIPDTLRLKEGALVMLLANRRTYDGPEDAHGRILYANGDLGHLVGESPGQDAWMVTLHRNGLTVPVSTVTRYNTIPLEVGRKKEITAEVAAEVNRELDAEGWGETDEAGVARADSFEFQSRTQRKRAARLTDDGKQEIIGTVTYMPMRAAYGCTVHKTQGLTLDRVQINIRDPFFRHPGMLFVALSRCRTADGLRIVGDQRGFVERCRVEPRVQPWL